MEIKSFTLPNELIAKIRTDNVHNERTASATVRLALRQFFGDKDGVK